MFLFLTCREYYVVPKRRTADNETSDEMEKQTAVDTPAG